MYQSLTIVGNCGSDPQMRYTPSGTPVTSLSVATNRTYMGTDGQKVKETTWFRVSVFGKGAETSAQYLKKGDAVLVEGRLSPDKGGTPRVYQRPDGTYGSSYEVVANTVRFMPKKDSPEQPETEHQKSSAEDEIPF